MTPPAMTWLDQHHMRLGTVDFHCDLRVRAAPDGRLPVKKQRSLVEGYAGLAHEGGARQIVELGIHSGGSTAMLRELFQPEKLVAVELAEAPVGALTDYIAEHALGDTVRPYYGVDQGDRARLIQIVNDEFGDEPLDLVVDDASHRYAETVASFDVLFPRLRPGGRFVIEDWRWEHAIDQRMKEIEVAGGEVATDQAERLLAAMADRPGRETARPTPFSTLVLELVLAHAQGGHTVAGLTMRPSWVVVERGPAPLDASSFRLCDLYDDQHGQLVHGGGGSSGGHPASR